MNDKKIIDFRNQALYYTTKAKRFKILIETVTGCYGKCLGCAFTEQERSLVQPLIPSSNLKLLFSRLNELLDFESDKSIVDKYDTTVINFGGSEHFIYDKEYLSVLFKETGNFFNNVKTKRNVLAFSSSGLANIDKMDEKSIDMVKFLDKDQFVVDFVIDLNRFEQLKERYQKSFNFFKERFGFLDLAVNIESFIDKKDWKAFCNFVDQNGVLNIDLVYSLNNNNNYRVAIESSKLFEVYKTIVSNTKQGKGLFDIHNLLRLKNSDYYLQLENLDFNDLCKETAKNILKDAIFIDHEFNIYPTLFVIFADVPLNNRLNLPPIANLFDNDIKQKIKKYENFLSSVLLKNYSKSIQCVDCPILKSCYQTGAPLLNPILNNFNGKKVQTFEDCQSPVKHFILSRDNHDLILKENEIE